MKTRHFTLLDILYAKKNYFFEFMNYLIRSENKAETYRLQARVSILLKARPL